MQIPKITLFFFLFLPKHFSLCIKKQNPALTVVLTSVIPKLRCIFWYFSEMLMGKKSLSFLIFLFVGSVALFLSQHGI